MQIPHILVVDDEAAISELFTDFFNIKEIPVTAVPSGEAALKILADTSSYELIFCDLRMPGLCGPSLVQRLHETAPNATIVLMTGALEDTDVGLAMEAGAVETLFKPFQLDRVLEICATYLRPTA